MYAVFSTGGKQYKVKENQTLKIEKIQTDDENCEVFFDKVLLLSDCNNDVIIGKPYIDGAKITAEIINNGRHKKIKIIKFKRRKHSMKKMGHRQFFTEIKIKEIKNLFANK